MHVLSALGIAAFHPIYYKYHASVTLPPSNTIVLDGKPGPTFVPIIGILIHPAIRPQQTWAENWGGAVPLWG